jgi:hypothetical protein
MSPRKYAIERGKCQDCGVVFLYRRKGHRRHLCRSCARNRKASSYILSLDRQFQGEPDL